MLTSLVQDRTWFGLCGGRVSDYYLIDLDGISQSGKKEPPDVTDMDSVVYCYRKETTLVGKMLAEKKISWDNITGST